MHILHAMNNLEEAPVSFRSWLVGLGASKGTIWTAIREPWAAYQPEFHPSQEPRVDTVHLQRNKGTKRGGTPKKNRLNPISLHFPLTYPPQLQTTPEHPHLHFPSSQPRVPLPRQKQTSKQASKQTNKQTSKQTKTNKQTNQNKQTKTNKPKQTNQHKTNKPKQAGNQAIRQAGKQASRQAGKQASRQAGKQASRQARSRTHRDGSLFRRRSDLGGPLQRRFFGAVPFAEPGVEGALRPGDLGGHCTGALEGTDATQMRSDGFVLYADFLK